MFGIPDGGMIADHMHLFDHGTYEFFLTWGFLLPSNDMDNGDEAMDGLGFFP